MSTPLVVVALNGTVLTGWLAVTVDAPQGSGSLKCTIQFAGVSQAVQATDHLQVSFGYAQGGTDLVFDSYSMESSLYSVEITKDGLSATWVSGLDQLRLRTVLETEYWASEGGGLHDFMRYIAKRVGYENGIYTNLPDIALPERVPILPTEGYWNTLNKIIDPFRPLILPDEIARVLYLWWLDEKIPAGALTIPIAKGESAGIPKTRNRIVNVVVLKYLVPKADGGKLLLDCAVPGSFYADPTGQVIGTTMAGCGVEVDPSEDADLVDRISYQSVPPPDAGSAAIQTIIERRDRLAVVYDDAGNVRGEPIITSRTETAYATDGVVTLGPVYRTETKYTFIRGTAYQHSAGHRSTTQARVDMPLVGEEWVGDLYEEAETIEYLIFKSGDLLKYRSSKQTWGRVLFPENVPLYEAVNNRGVYTAADTYQYTEGKQPLTWEVEELLPAGGSVKYLRRRYNYLTRRYEGPGEEGDTGGSLPKTSDLTPQEVNEIYPNQIYSYIDEDGIKQYAEPDETWQVPEEVDGTWIGTNPLIFKDRDPLEARDWCILMAEAKFRRSGARIAEYDVTIKKYVSKAHRGACVWAVKRNQAQPHKAVITGVTFTAERTADAAYIVKTRIHARRLEPFLDA